MTTKSLDDRREALEEAFFRKENAKHLSQLREEREHARLREALGLAMNTQDQSLLDLLVDAGIRAETWHALTLFPLCEVAWADREVTPAEREKIHEAAARQGILAESQARSLLDQWLTTRPTSTLREAWKAYMGLVHGRMDEAEQARLRADTIERAREVARATNHLLGYGRRISDAEAAVLEELETVL